MCALVPTVADQFGLSGVWLTIAFMGAVQGPLFPTSSVYLSRWMPGKTAPQGDEKAWGTSMLDIGISVGSLLIIPVGNGLAEAYGWRGAYRILGGATIGFVALWQVMAAETPRGCWFIGAEELKYLEAHVAAPSSGKPKPKAADGKPAASDGGYFAALTGLPAEARPRRLKMMPPALFDDTGPSLPAWCLAGSQPLLRTSERRLSISEARGGLRCSLPIAPKMRLSPPFSGRWPSTRACGRSSCATSPSTSAPTT